MLAYQQYCKHKNELPLVLVHGFLCSGDFFSPNIKHLRKYRNIITIDLPGFGQSATQKGVASISEMAQQVLTTLDKLSYPKFHLLGHSMGGMVALQMGLTASQRIASLILYATNSDGDIRERFETFAETQIRLRQNLTLAKQHICATWFCDGEKHKHFPLVLNCSDVVNLQTAIDAIEAMRNFNMTKQIATLSIPTLVVGAEKDRTYSPHIIRTLHTNIPQSQIRILKNCAHNAHLESETEFNKILLDWLTIKRN